MQISAMLRGYAAPLALLAMLCGAPLRAGDAGATAPLSDALQLPAGIERLPRLKEEISARLNRLASTPDSREAALELAYLYHANGYDEKARIVYDWLVATHDGGEEERSKLNYLAAQAVRGKGDSAAADAYLQASIAAFDRYPPALVLAGDAKFKVNELDAAEDLYLRSLALDADWTSARFGLARVYESRGDVENAVVELEEILRSEPEHYNAKAMLAQLYARRGESDRAAMLTQSIAISTAPAANDPWMEPVFAAIFDPQRLDFRFLDYFMVDRFDEALPILERMESIDPANPRNFQYRGQLYLETGRFAEAEDSFREGLNSGGELSVFYPLLVKAVRLDARLSEAESLAREGIERGGPNAELCMEIARMLFDREQFAEALSMGEIATQAAPYDLEAHLLRARLGMWAGDLKQAQESLAMVQQLAPRNAVVLVRAALVCMEASRFAEAMPILRQAIGAAPSNLEAVELLADAHVQLGKAAMSLSDWQLALSHFDNALSGAPQSVEALNARAQLLMRLGRFAEAESALSQLLQRVGESPTLLLVYGDALYQNSKGEQARSSWQRAQALLGSGAADPRLRQALTERLGR